MSSCGLTASEGQRFNRKWRKERDAGHIIMKNTKTASEAAGQTPPTTWMELVSLLGFVRLAFISCICVAALFHKVTFCCVINWIPGALPELCCALISFRTAVEPFLLPIWDRRLEHNEVVPAGQCQKGRAIG